MLESRVERYFRIWLKDCTKNVYIMIIRLKRACFSAVDPRKLAEIAERKQLLNKALKETNLGAISKRQYDKLLKKL